MKLCAEKLKDKKTPCLFVSTKSDGVVHLHTATKMANACGVTSGMQVHFDSSYAYEKGIKRKYRVYKK